MKEPNIKEIREAILEGKPFTSFFLGVQEDLVYHKALDNYLTYGRHGSVQVDRVSDFQIEWHVFVLDQFVEGTIQIANCVIKEESPAHGTTRLSIA